MKQKTLVGIIVILLIANVTITIKCITLQKRIKFNQLTYKNLDSQFELKKRLLVFNYNHSNKQIDTTKILINKSTLPLEELLSIKDRLVLFYDSDVCDVCEDDLFRSIATFDKKLKDEMIILVPINNFNDFINYNNSYNMNFSNVFGYKEDLLGNKIKIGHGIFFELNKEFRIWNIFIPIKPFVKEEFDQYLAQSYP